MSSIDIFVQSHISLTRTPGLTSFLYLVTILFDFSFHFILISLCVAGLVYLVRSFKYSVLFLGSIFCGGVLVNILKFIFNVNRPIGGVVQAFSRSFPSGHATVSTIFFIMLMYIFDDYLVGWKRKLFNTFCVVGIFLIALSRVYLGVHWVSDVSFGILLGCLVSLLSILVYRRFLVKM